MFKFNKKKNFFARKKYKIERGGVKYRNPLRLKKWLLQFKLFKAINLILLFCILAGLYFFLFSDFYNITNVEVSGNQIISTEDLLDISNNFIAKNRLFILKNKNIFLFSKDGLKKKINEVVLLDDIKIEKIIPNTIRISIKEKDAALKWLTNSQEYLVDKQGTIIKRYYKLITPTIFLVNSTENAPTNNENDSFTKISNLANEQANLGDKVLGSQDIDFIVNLKEKLSHNTFLSISSYSVPNNFPQFLIVGTADGWNLYLNLVDSLDAQLSRLDILIREKIKKENLPRLEYIDLRLGESVYYKMK